MEEPAVQQLFFRHIRNTLPPHLSLVDEIAALLNISNDSAYRRIRGEKGIGFDEIRTLCAHFHISLDQLLHLDGESLLFSGRMADQTSFPFDLYLKGILDQLKFMNSFERRELIYLNKDIPIFHYFYYHELAAFKFFFWMKTILQYPLPGKTLFAPDEFMDGLHTTSARITEEYLRIPSQEVWNVENIHSTIRQIEYYKETRVFRSADDILRLYDCLLNSIDHIEKQAELGCKFRVDKNAAHPGSGYKLFINEFILGDNTICALLDDTRVVYLNHSVLNFVATKDPAFTEYTYQHSQNIIRRSTLISDVGEKERSRFFNTMREKIHNRKKAVNHY